MMEILKQNITADKKGLYHSLALHCGVNRVGKSINDYFDAAFCLLKDKVRIDGNMISV